MSTCHYSERTSKRPAFQEASQIASSNFKICSRLFNPEIHSSGIPDFFSLRKVVHGHLRGLIKVAFVVLEKPLPSGGKILELKAFCLSNRFKEHKCLVTVVGKISFAFTPPAESHGFSRG